AAHVGSEPEEVDRERSGGAHSAEHGIPAPVPEARGEGRRTQSDVGNLAKLRERRRNASAAALAASHVDDEAISLEMTHQATVNCGVGPEAVLGVEKEDRNSRVHDFLAGRFESAAAPRMSPGPMCVHPLIFE